MYVVIEINEVLYTLPMSCVDELELLGIKKAPLTRGAFAIYRGEWQETFKQLQFLVLLLLCFLGMRK